MYKQLGLGELKPTNITLSLADRSVKVPKVIIEDVLVKVDNFYYPVDFVVLDTELVAEGTNQVPIILGSPFLATSNAIINCRNGVMQLTFGNMTLELNIFHLNNKHDLKEKQEQGSKKAYLSCPGEGECGPHKLQDEVTKGIKAADEKLNSSITPPGSMVPIAPLDGKILTKKGAKSEVKCSTPHCKHGGASPP